MYTLSLESKTAVIAALVEGNSIRSIERMTGTHRDTIMRLMVGAGDRCGRLLNQHVRNVRAKRVQVDEIWTYVFKHEKRVTSDDPPAFGDQYVFVAMDADTKLVISHIIGKRSPATAFDFMEDLRSRLLSRVQLTSDGFKPYLTAVEDNFGSDVDYAMLVKVYGSDNGQGEGPAWYGPAQVISAVPTPISGRPDWAHISTSYIERQNLTIRMQLRRFTRSTNAYSKKLENLKAHVALHFAHYNYCRTHSTLRVTPAMEAGITDHAWTIGELLAA